MNALREEVFDKIAIQYDAVWSDTPVGRAQRSAVWRWIDPLFKEGYFVLDLGCGTGIDAEHLESRGVSVYGIDSSSRMVEAARRRGIRADRFPIEQLQHIGLKVDGVISNFGVLNCLPSLTEIAGALARMVRPGGHLALCFIGRFCLWESIFYLSQAKPDKAFRRRHGSASSSLGVRVFYPSPREIVSAFEAKFRLLDSHGIGFFVPPSYVSFFTSWEVEQLAALDRGLAHRPVFRSLADHRLYIFERI